MMNSKLETAPDGVPCKKARNDRPQYAPNAGPPSLEPVMMLNDEPELPQVAPPLSPQPVMLTEFQKYAKLQPELQCYILSFANYNTLANYACCSSDCNKQVQKFNNRIPSNIGITEKLAEDPSKLIVSLEYKKNDDTPIRMNQELSVDSALEYLTDKLQYAKYGKWASVCVDVHNWPADIMNLPRIKRCRMRNMTIRESMYPGFYDWIKDENQEGLEFMLEKAATSDFVIPAPFFKTDFFLNLSKFYAKSELPELPAADFLDMKATTIYITDLHLNDDIVNRKLYQWFENPIPVTVDYNLHRAHIPENKFHKDAILRNLPVVERSDNCIILKHSTGVKARIQFESHHIVFNPDSKGMMLYNFSVSSKSVVTRRRAKRKLEE